MDPIAFIRSRLDETMQANPNYSLRSFARSVRVDAGTLSKILHGKRSISVPLAIRISERFCFDSTEREVFLNSVSIARSSRKVNSDQSTAIPSRRSKSVRQDLLENEAFDAISSWYHVAILEASAEANGLPSSARQVASRFGITQIQAQSAITRLQNLGLIGVRQGNLVKTNSRLSTKDKSRTSDSLRKLHAEFLEKAAESCRLDPIDKRVMSAMTFSIDPRKMHEARKLTSKYLQAMERLLETGENRRVYNLSVSLFPLEKG